MSQHRNSGKLRNSNKREKWTPRDNSANNKDLPSSAPIPTLSCGRAKDAKNNWQTFSDKMSTYLGSEFGLRGTFIDNDGEAQDPEAPRHPRWIGMT